MKEIISLTLGPASDNIDDTFEVAGTKIRVKQLGTDLNASLLKDLIRKYSGKVDAMTISGLPTPIKVGDKEVVHPLLQDLHKLSEPTPLLDGSNLRNIVVPWCLNHFNQKDPDFLKNKKIGFFMGFAQKYLIKELESYGAKCLFADPYFLTKAPLLIKGEKKLDTFFKPTLPIFTRVGIKKMGRCDFTKPYLKKSPFFKEFFDCDIYILNSSQLEYITIPDLTGKSVIVESLTKTAKKILEEKNVDTIYKCSLDVDVPFFDSSTNKLEALFQTLKDESSPLDQEEIQYFIEKLNLRPQAIEINKSEESKARKFAFIIHPLSASHLLKHPSFKLIKNNKFIKNNIEKVGPHLPTFHYGQIKGIKSESTGVTALGDIFVTTETPKMMMKQPTEKMYKKLINITKQADDRGNQLIGLGAFTKIVGDAGVTINKYSPIPVTTGNSLSAAATLWAASYAIDKMKFITKVGEKYPGTVMVVGATGSIGKVNSKVLCQYWDKVIIVAPKLYKLIDLKDEMKAINPECEVVYSTKPDEYIDECDLIITTTSARGKKILDIEKVKPGCVICDVSRPFDISEEDMLKRPDVLVIASGEVELPGDVNFKIDIGLAGNAVYACLAETAILTLEGRYESFSLSRDISYQKVFDIDQMARKHGVKLAAIMGHSLEITDDEIELCRQHALKARPE